MHRLFSLILSFGFIFNLFTCKNPVAPDNSFTPGRRDYTWTIDTLNSPPNLFSLVNIWGSGPSDVWAVGPADETLNSLWHYDGISWKPTTQRLSSNLWSVFGFGQSNVWMCDGPGRDIFYFNGNIWVNQGNYSYPGYSMLYLNSIWGTSNSELYCAGSAYDSQMGTQPVLMKYNNNAWNFIQLPKNDFNIVTLKKDQDNNIFFFTAIKFTTGYSDTNKIYTYDGTSLKEIFKGTNNPVDNATADDIGGKVYLNIKNKIYKYIDNKLVLWKDFDGTSYGGRVFGRNENDFFGFGYDGVVHYNGTDLKTIFPTTMSLTNLLVLDKDIFLLCDNRIIVHGHLK